MDNSEELFNFSSTENLKLDLHPDKVSVKTMNSGVDFLGWVHFPKYRILRRTTKIRMYQKIFPETKPEVVNSYFGLLSYGNTYKLKRNILEGIAPDNEMIYNVKYEF